MTKWCRPLTPADGMSSEAIGQIERRLETPLPTSLREFCALFGNCLEEFEGQDSWISPAHWEWSEEEYGKVLVLVSENQGCAEWLISDTDAGDDNPPVLCSIEGTEGDVCSDTFSEFATGRFIYETVLCGDCLFHTQGSLSPEAVRQIERSYARTMTRRGWPTPCRFYESPKMLLIVMVDDEESDANGFVWAVAKAEDSSEIENFEMLYLNLNA